MSLPALFDRAYNGGDLRVRTVLARTSAYTSYSVSYRSDRFRISGKLDVPRGRGPFPAVVLAHGYIDPAVYVNGQGLRREQDWLARAGYVVLHVDYRNHAFSSRVPTAERNLRLGYTVDVINAVKALRGTDLAPVADDRIGLLGRSMGGGVGPERAGRAAGTGRGRRGVRVGVLTDLRQRGALDQRRPRGPDPGRPDPARPRHPADRPRVLARVSPRTYVDRITEPVLLHHGTADSTCPSRWSRETVAAMRKAGVDARLFTYPGEEHAFVAPVAVVDAAHPGLPDRNL